MQGSEGFAFLIVCSCIVRRIYIYIYIYIYSFSVAFST